MSKSEKPYSAYKRKKLSKKKTYYVRIKYIAKIKGKEKTSTMYDQYCINNW